IDGKLYVASDDGLWTVQRQDGKYKKFTDREWYNVHALVALDSKLYISTNDALFEVDASGKYQELAGIWPNVNGMAAANGKIYVFTNDPVPRLHQLDKSGKDNALPLPKGWDGSTGINGMAVLNDKLLLVEPNMGSTITLFSVDTK